MIVLRQMAKEDREARKASGALVDRGRVLAELSQLIEALRIMREGMPDKIGVELSKCECKRLRRVVRLLLAPLKLAVAKVRESEDTLFQSLESLTSTNALRDMLKLEAA
jgi:hypothetical protein